MGTVLYTLVLPLCKISIGKGVTSLSKLLLDKTSDEVPAMVAGKINFKRCMFLGLVLCF